MMGNYRSSAAQQIKEQLTAEDVARRYGFTQNRSGFIRCPFHQGDRHASLKLYPEQGGWHCFGCHRGGTVIDFVMELFGISFTQAVVRLNADFGLGLTYERPSPIQQSAVLEARRKEREQKEAADAEFFRLAHEHRYLLEAKKLFAPTREAWEAGAIHPLYLEAVRRLDWLEYVTDDMLLGGEGYDRTEHNRPA